ncbi:FtsX-like permease family protein [Candidatus Peregrinibacteria bacterium]|nr:FtsX-like permease family protein [Candidatus Peregrinibacteria bacterium]
MKKYLLIIKLALIGIFTNKVRAFLTMLGIIIGVSSVIAIISIGEGAQSLITGSIKSFGTDTLTVLPGASDESGPPASAFGIVITTLTNDDAKEIEKLPHVLTVTSYISGNGEIVYGSRSVLGNFTGVTADYETTENHDVIEGRFFTKQEERAANRVAVLGSEMKEELFPLTNPLGQKVRINDQTFTVIGVLESKGSQLARNFDNQVIVPLSAAQKILLGFQHVSLIRIKVDTEESVEVTKKRIEDLLIYRHEIKDRDDKDFSVRAVSQALDTFNSITLALSFFLAAIAAISLIVGGIGITNIMLMVVKERTREIGLRKALGAKPFHIKNQFLLEALVLTVIGGILGILAGVGLSVIAYFVINYMGYDWEFVVPLYSIVVSIGISGAIGIIFGTYPANKAAELNPIVAIRYE